jgi:hypothetical protein
MKPQNLKLDFRSDLPCSSLNLRVMPDFAKPACS